MSLTRIVCLLAALALITAWAGVFGGVALAQERGISLTTTYTNIAVEPGQDIVLSITVANDGDVGENIDLEVSSGPDDWGAIFRDQGQQGYKVQSVYLAAGASQAVDFVAETPLDAEVGDYRFVLKAEASDQGASSSLAIDIAVSETGAATGEVLIVAQYPKQSSETSSAGTYFQFDVNIRNLSSDDQSFDLVAYRPSLGWNISFKASEKTISSLLVAAGRQSSVTVLVVAPAYTIPDAYPITVIVGSGETVETLDLTATVTGAGELYLETETGALNADATAGNETTVRLLVYNLGSKTLQNIAFSPYQPPTGWKVSFEPDTIEEISPQTLSSVAVTITPSKDSIPGDYDVKVRASGADAFEEIELRVTVETSTLWGWIGIIIVIIVVAAVAVVFMRVGRR
ncbi:NEW3 domain-containing protein [Chloroflexota bacterium]